MATEKPYSAASERNRDPILAVLREHFADRRRVLEIGSGSGQHAVHFAAALPHLLWQATDRAEQLPGIALWLAEAALPNTPPAIAWDVNQGPWPVQRYDGAFSANTLHIMSWIEVQRLFAALNALLADEAKLVIYGPFNYAGAYTSASNADFDRALKRDAPTRGIRNMEDVDGLARGLGFRLCADVAMPANNRCLVWQRHAAAA